ncbi:pentatricopeptide repeat-containing protein At2g30100, chloroplastic [Lycium ferocissimum]|uniref:pentatricopeptide repeat-containing protein At2g30100, chloroplastic n=1 Tax=Lycium ferocissimum TaxID=112874 RepID=UPI002816983D|nr:pentatricopeptide repeat-containing protein At2g30100, chloroplastic [Lycium ferocissimum]
MAITVNEIAAFTYLRLNNTVSPKPCQTWLKLRNTTQSCSKFLSNSQNPSFDVVIPRRRNKMLEFRLFNSVELDRFVTSEDDEEEEENEMSDCFFEAIEELERMNREPSDVLEEMNDKLSDRELQLVLVYFAQEGRDSWCALEVFEWLRKENRVDKETMELMVSIMCGWVQKLIGSKSEPGDVVDLLVDMDCVGLNPSFSMVEKVISLYWDAGERDGALSFVKEVLRRRIAYSDGNADGHKAGPTGYLAWKMMEEGNYKGAVKLVMEIRDSGLKPELYSYLIAMTAVVKELNEFGKALRKLKGFSTTGLIAELDLENLRLVEEYQADMLAKGVQLSDWLIREGGPSLFGVVHERLLAMYVCAGRGIEAERHLWQMKLAGKEVSGDLHDIVLAICASQKELGPISRLLARMEASTSLQKKKTLSWLLRGFIKGGHLENAAETVIKMLDLGLYPDFLDRAAVLQRLRRRIQESGNLETYLNLCKHLSDASLIGPCLVYLYMKKYKLWIVRTL